ncbi:MAG TPA: hypothetical protein VK787_07115, partial [Puia sp.]|nr:hypothetical protein [Puia sp.]
MAELNLTKLLPELGLWVIFGINGIKKRTHLQIKKSHKIISYFLGLAGGCLAGDVVDVFFCGRSFQDFANLSVRPVQQIHVQALHFCSPELRL